MEVRRGGVVVCLGVRFFGESGGKFLCVEGGLKVVECCVRGKWCGLWGVCGRVCLEKERPKITPRNETKY